MQSKPYLKYKTPNEIENYPQRYLHCYNCDQQLLLSKHIDYIIEFSSTEKYFVLSHQFEYQQSDFKILPQKSSHIIENSQSKILCNCTAQFNKCYSCEEVIGFKLLSVNNASQIEFIEKYFFDVQVLKLKKKKKKHNKLGKKAESIDNQQVQQKVKEELIAQCLHKANYQIPKKFQELTYEIQKVAQVLKKVVSDKY